MLIALVHTPPVRRWGLERLIRLVAERAELDLAASRLDLNLLTRRVTLHDVRLAAPGHASDPFLTAARVSAVLSLAALRGEARLDALELETARVLLLREGGVLVNLPPSSGAPPPATPRRFGLDGLAVRGLDVDYADRTGDVDVSVRGLNARLDVASGSAAPSGPIDAAGIRVRLAERGTESGPVTGRLAFDGATVSIESLSVGFPEGTVTARGDVTRALDDARFALELTGGLDFAALTAWTPTPVPVSGPGTFTGRLTGPLGEYELRAAFSSPGLRVARANGLPLTGTLVVTPPQALVEPFRLTIPASPEAPRAGVVEGRFLYRFEPGSSDVAVTWRDLDLDSALAAYDQEPTTAAAWQQGTARIRVASAEAPMTMRASGTSRPLARRDRIAVDGTWQAELDGTRWRVEHDHRLLDTVRASGSMTWPVADDPARAAVSGPLELTIADVGPMVAAARRSGIDLSEALADVHGPAAGRLVMDGTLDRLVVRGRVESADLTWPGGAPGSAWADVVYDEEALRVPAFEIGTPGGHVAGDVVMGMESGRLSGAFRASADDLARLAGPYADLPGLSGTVEASGTLGGTTDVPDVPFIVISTPIGIDGQRVGTVDAEARLLGTEVSIVRLVVDQGPGRLSAQGRVDYLSGQYDVSIDGRDLHWANPQPDAPVESFTVQLAFAGAGTAEAPGGSGSLIVTPVGGSLGDLVGDADVRWQFAGGLLNASAFLPKLRTWAQATAEPRAPYAYRGLAAVTALDVQPFLLAVGALPDAISGTVGLSAMFEGRLDDVSTAQAFLNLQDVELSVGGLPVALDRPARVTVRADDFSVDDLALTAGRTTLAVAGRFHDTTERPLRASLTGVLSDVLALAHAFGATPDGISATGAIRATWESRGGLDRAQSAVAIVDGAVTAAGLPPIEALNTTATFDGATLEVDRFSAAWQGAALEGRATLPRAVLEAAADSPAPSPGRVDLALRNLTQQALAQWLPVDTISRTELRVSATAGLDVSSLTLDGLRGGVVFDEAAVTAAGVPIEQARPIRLSLANRVLSLDDVAFTAGAPVVIAGAVTLGDEPALDVRVTGSPGLRPFSVLAPGMAADGTAKVDLHVTGTAEAPRVNGRIDLDGAEAVLRDPRVIASGISGAILFEGDRVTLGDITGGLNGGDFVASGSARVLGVDTAAGVFTFQARGVAVEHPQDVNSEIDALLTFTAGDAPVLSGDVRVKRAPIAPPSACRRWSPSTPPAPSWRPSRLSGSRVARSLDLDRRRHRHRQQLRPVRGRCQPARAGHERPAVGDRPGRTPRGRRGVHAGQPLPPERERHLVLEPERDRARDEHLDGDAVERRRADADAVGHARSTGDQRHLHRPERAPQRRRRAARRQHRARPRAGAAAAVGRAARRHGAGGGPRQPAPRAGVRGGRHPAGPWPRGRHRRGPSTRLTLAKQLRPDVEVVLSQGIDQGALAGYVTYRPLRGLELRATSLDDTDRLCSVRHDISFGGAQAAAPARRPSVDVSAVTFSGAGAADEPALRDRLKIRRGDPFDFLEWRDDVERLRAWYRERGFFEARVGAARSEGRDGRVALAYTIDSGPPTELRVAGMDVTRQLRQRLEEAWSNAVFDRFLLEEIESALRFDLMRQNVVQADIETSVETTVAGKRILATVRQGPAARRRRVAYEGQHALTADQLDDELARRGLADQGWLYPASIARALRERYAEDGYRAAAIRAAEPALEGDEAVLRVVIDEGPATTVTRASLSDAGPLSGELAPVVSALEGRPYRPAEVDSAVRRIERRYQDAGFNNARATPVVELAAETASATIAIEVEPGREQRLAEVVVSGAERTHPGAVVRALGLREGAPVNFTQWALARKRVYDTNVFRQVDVRPEVLPQPNADGSEAVRARVTLSEWPTWRLRYGLQLDDRSETGQSEETSAGRQRTLGVVANLQNRNLFGRAMTFGVYGQVARRLQSGNTYLTFPTLFRLPVQTNLFAASSRQELPNELGVFETLRQRSLLSVEQRIRRGNGLQIAYGYRLKHEIVDALEEDNPFLLDVTTGRFTGAAFVDRRDDPFNATRGWFTSVNLERLSVFGASEDAVKAQAALFHFRPFGPVVAASAVRIGGSFLNPLPFLERFYTGGADTVRGYAESFVGPRNILGDARGGNALLLLNQEIRAPIYGWLRGVAFVDAGNVFDTNGDIRLHKLDVGYGVGLRLHTPFSIFRVDLGFPAGNVLVYTPDGYVPRRTARWYFGLGHIF
ncbi:MAG: BamA/TamA family outer membrane protein [Vicinamibacterales bacterium]